MELMSSVSWRLFSPAFPDKKVIVDWEVNKKGRPEKTRAAERAIWQDGIEVAMESHADVSGGPLPTFT